MKLEDFQFGIEVPEAGAKDLEACLTTLEFGEQALRDVEVARNGATGTVVALLAFQKPLSSGQDLSWLAALAEGLQGQLLDVAYLELGLRLQFGRLLEMHPSRTTGRGCVAAAFATLAQLSEGPPAIRLAFDDEAALLSAWARNVTEGGLWVPSARPPPADTLHLVLATPQQEYPDNAATLVDRPAPGGQPGFWLQIHAGLELEGLLRRRAVERKQGRSSPAVNLGVRPAERVDQVFEVRFKDLADLAQQYADDLSHGGIFVRCDPLPELRARVRVRLCLPDDSRLELDAEVVQRVLSGPRNGTGLQFSNLEPSTFAPIEALLASQPKRPPRVLVVDDEAIWRSTLSRVCSSLGAEVELAQDGRDGLLKLIDGYFDLDLVILDLHMPNLDGHGLAERVRVRGGEAGLKIFLCSAADREELATMSQSGLVNQVFSKLDSLDALATRIASELGRTWAPAA